MCLLSVSDFVMERTLGCGSFGRVKYAKYKKDNVHYAVKFMKKHEIMKLKQVYLTTFACSFSKD